jgi:hypothetical protein
LPKDRWGSATNLARPDGEGWSQVLDDFLEHFNPDELDEIEKMVLQVTVLNTELIQS